MPEETTDQEKTEQPTPHRLEEAREKGEVTHSREVITVAIFFAAIIYFTLTLNSNLGQMKFIVSEFLSFDKYLNLNTTNVLGFLIRVLCLCAPVLLPLFLLIVVMGLVSNLAQVGFLFSSEKLKIDFNKLNPVKGMKRLCSKRQLFEGLKTVIKVTIVGVISYWSVKGEMKNMLLLYQLGLEQEIRYIVGLSLRMAFRIALLMILFAAIDYAFQRYMFIKQLRMTKQEMKDEYKEREGDPMIKQRIKSIHREWAQKRMMAEVPTADVVVTNPIHYAVALRYDQFEMPAPRVVAKGQRLIAERIKQVAKEHDVPIVEDPPLAQTLYKNVDIGQEIPHILYKAVAEVLSYVYKISKKKKNWF